MTSPRKLRTRRGAEFRLPLFMPVFQTRTFGGSFRPWDGEPTIEACIVNSFFLYKERSIREKFDSGLKLSEFLGFDGLITTDSGAFQNFTRPVLVPNKTIVKFQDKIGTDVAAPMDLVTPPGDKRVIAEKKLATTQKRIAEALKIAENCLVACVQQGGRFLDLRRKSVEGLVELGMEYLAIGSLVPFFNKNHNLSFVAPVIREAREIAGPEVPMHIYGAGDPVEIPFFVKLGADIFDSSSYGHYAEGGWYMTIYGALKDTGPLTSGEYKCACPVCKDRQDFSNILTETEPLRLHNLWTICHAVDLIRAAIEEDRFDAWLQHLLERHTAWFPESDLEKTWL